MSYKVVASQQLFYLYCEYIRENELSMRLKNSFDENHRPLVYVKKDFIIFQGIIYNRRV